MSCAEDMEWLRSCLIHGRPRQTRYKIDADGQRYLALLPYLRARGRATPAEEGSLAVYLRYPEFAFDGVMLHGKTETALALQIFDALSAPEV